MTRKPARGSADDEAKIVRDALKRRKLPASVKGYDFEFGEDWTGDPAVHIYFEVDDDLSPSGDKIAALTALAQSVELELLKLGLTHSPFVKFRASAKAG